LLSIGAFASIVVFKANDVIFAQVVAALHLDNVHRLVIRTGDLVDVTDRDAGRLAKAQHK
jgi:hypothetical protein